MTRWFRFYDSVLDDPKVQRLPDAAFRAWVNLMCVACRNGGKIPADFDDIAFALRTTKGKARDLIQILQSSGLIDRFEEDYEPHNWRNRQYDSDSAAERMKRYRKRNALRNGAGNAIRNSDVPDTDTDTEAEVIPLAKANGRANAPPLPEKAEAKPAKLDPWAEVYAKGKSVLGENAGGQITKLKQTFPKPNKVLAILAQAGDAIDPREYVAKILLEHAKPGMHVAAGYVR